MLLNVKKSDEINYAGNIEGKQQGYVYSVYFQSGLAPTLSTMQGGANSNVS